MVMCPPRNLLWSLVLPESLALGSDTRRLRTGVSLTMGANLSPLQVAAISKVGCRHKIGEGS